MGVKNVPTFKTVAPPLNTSDYLTHVCRASGRQLFFFLLNFQDDEYQQFNSTGKSCSVSESRAAILKHKESSAIDATVHPSSYKNVVISDASTSDDNIRTGAVSALILLPVANLPAVLYSANPISHETVKGNFSKLVKKRS